MEFHLLAPNGPVMMIPKVFGDDRGYFMETFRLNEFQKHCGSYDFVQDNQSKSRGGVLRGLHYQLNHPQGKLVRVISGTVFDVAVDLRNSSPTFGKAFYAMLDAEKNIQFWVPPGFAHGFMVLSDTAEFIYKCTAYYAPDDEHCLKWNDPDLDIPWPQAPVELILSEKDQKGQPFASCPCYD